MVLTNQRSSAAVGTVREMLVVLGTINVLQPIKVRALVEGLSKDFDDQRLRRTIRRLARDGLIMRLRDGKYVVSRKGRSMLPHGSLSKERDVSRMFTLIERSRGGGGD